MSAPNDGCPAFPGDYREIHRTLRIEAAGEQYHVLSLRDWFAGQAISSAMTDLIREETNGRQFEIDGKILKNEFDVFSSPQWVASLAYQIADAMLAERAKKPEGAE